MEIITSINNKKIKNVSRLLEKKYRDTEDKFLVYGTHLVNEAYKNGYLLEVYKCLDYKEEYDCLTTIVSYDVLKKLTGAKNPQKIVGVCKKIGNNAIGKHILLLDNVQDPGNLGTIIRSAVAFNVDTIILSITCVDLYNEKVIRATEGMLFNINVIRTNIVEMLDELKKDNYTIYGTSVVDGSNVRKININDKYALVMGNEGNGVSSEVLEKCDELLYIPISKKCESLNVGVATSIILYDFNEKVKD